MTTWEYMYVEVIYNRIKEINQRRVGEYQGLFKGHEGKLTVSEYLEKSGQEGWEVVGLCPANEMGSEWRLILKRPLL